MEPPCSLIDEPAHLLDRVVGKHRLAVVVPLEETDAASPTEIDRGPQVHGGISGGAAGKRRGNVGGTAIAGHERSTNARRRRMPVSWLFSGWNCVANNRPRATAAQNSPP